MAIIEVVQLFTTAAELADRMAGYSFTSVRTEPKDIVVKDYLKSMQPGATIFALIDLSNMRVLESNCGSALDTLADACVDSHL